MLVFKILVAVAFFLCLVNLAFTVHMLICSNRTLKSIDNWASEIDRSNNRYIQQQFAVLVDEYFNNKDKKEEENVEILHTENE